MKLTILALGASCALGAVAGGWAYRYALWRSDESVKSLKEAHGRFIAAVADEFRSCAVAIAYSAGLLEELQSGEDRSRAALGRITGNADDLVRMANELIEICGPQDERKTSTRTERQPCDVGAEIHLVTSRTSALWSDHIVRVHAPDGLVAQTDIRAMRRVLEALLSNAAAYSPKGSLIVVRAHATGSELVVSVDDEGCGVEPNEVDQVFETLYRGPQSRRSHPGLGLGLPVANRMITDLGGRLWLESHPVRGSTFSFTIPSGRQRKPWKANAAKAGAHLPFTGTTSRYVP